MAIEVAKYLFQSWARRGIAAHINDADTLGNPATPLPPAERASVPIGVSINAQPQAPKQFGLYGPGDIIGVQREMVVRTEPRSWTSAFEPNYLAFVEFYDEDFPWRYTPARPQGDLLRPWIFLLVCRDAEFERDDRRLPLPVLKVREPRALPPSDETWLFAHVHTERDIPGSELSELEEYLRSLREVVTTDPDKIYSRLLSPRHLEPNQSYQAFVVPTFEAGRLAGLGKPVEGVPAQKPAWDAATTGLELPIYYEWSFRTGEQQDFESLVKLLEPKVLDARIGIRSMDCSEPGFVKVDAEGRARPLAPGEAAGLPAPAPVIQGLEGALRTDRTRSLPETFTANAFQDELQVLVNLPETIETNLDAARGSDEDFLNDPVVTVPFYGQNHARQHRTDKVLLDATKAGWYHDLNRDPRTRVAAGLGTVVVQKGQEQFVQKAWQQVEKVYEGNRKIRNFQFAIQVAVRYHLQFFSQVAPEKLLALTAPVHARVLGSPTTIRQQLSESTLAAPVLGSAFRRLARPGGLVARRLSGVGEPFELAPLIAAVNDGRVAPARPRRVPEGIPAVDDLARRINPRPLPGWMRWLMANRWLVLVAALAVLGLVAAVGMLIVAALLAVAAAAGFAYVQARSQRAVDSESLIDPTSALEAIARVPPRPDFRIEVEGAPPAPPPAPAPATEDSAEARSFRLAATRLYERLEIRAAAKPEPPPFDLASGRNKVMTAIDPRVAFPRRLSALVQIPERTLDSPEEIVDAMAHPDFEDAMYAPLRDVSKDLLIPNLDLIPPNSISLLETNPRFIESYIVGLNHEMGRELLWREYPTDLRGSYFRQFWEVKGVSNPDTPGDAEQLKDVTQLHSWPAASGLGTHKPPAASNADVKPGEKQVVLVIRGELLKRYPNTVIYAQKAIDDGAGNNVLRETDLTPEQFDEELKFPLFRAEIDPDLRFFGFDLTTEKAKGTVDSRDFPDDKRGWFFVIQEVPGEPRFGMDISYQPTQDTDNNPLNDPRDTWDNLAWNLFGAAEPTFVRRSPAPIFPRPNATILSAHPWAASSAQMAYSLFQTPAMVAVHASEMLEIDPPA